LNYEILPQHHLLKGELKEVGLRFGVTSAATVFLLRAVAMQILSRKKFKRGIVSNDTFHYGLMFIGIVIIQACPNEGISLGKTSSTFNHKIRFCTQQRYRQFWPENVFLSTFFLLVISVSLFHRLVSQELFP